MSLKYKKLNPITGSAKKIVILSHGYGADCNDLISIGEYWQRFLPEVCFVAPNAPTICQINPSGFEWFDLMQTSQDKILEEMNLSLSKLDSFINEQLAEHQLAKQDLFLMGFSQGTMMSLHLALSYKETIGGILGYSGKIYNFDVLRNNINSKPPIILFHGTEDTIIPLEEMYASYEFLKDKLPYVEYKVFDHCGHSILPEALSLGLDFIQSKINK